MLSPYQVSDLERLHELFTEPSIRKFIWGETPISALRTGRAIAFSAFVFDRLGFGHWAIRRERQPEVIGFCGLMPPGDEFRDEDLVQDDGAMELYYGLASAARGHGYMLEAVGAVLDYVFRSGRVSRIVALIDEENVSSRKVGERVGLRYARTVTADDELVRVYTLSAGDLEKRPAD